MMDVELTIKNYRCFPENAPARLRLRPGTTALVGPNNAGKSTLLKFFREFRPLFGTLAGPEQFRAGLENSIGFGIMSFNQDPNALFTRSTAGPLSIELRLFGDDDLTRGPAAIRHVVLDVDRADCDCRISLVVDGTPPRRGQARVRDDRFFMMPWHDTESDFNPLQEVFQKLAGMFYIGALRTAFNASPAVDYYDIQVGAALLQMWQNTSTGTEIALRDRAHELVDDIGALFGIDGLSIEILHDGTALLVKMGDHNYELHEVGEGLSQVIVTLVNLLRRKPSYILIDEPELNLHPRLQLGFVELLGDYAEEGVVFATHSIGLARAAAQDVYYVSADGDKGSSLRPLEKTPSLGEMLGELSFASYREMGFDGVLLVEGATDPATLRVLLRKYGKDHKLITISLGGNSYINANSHAALEEIKRITPNVVALIDNDKPTARAELGADRAAFQQTCVELGFRCHILEHRAIENYFPKHAIQRVKSEKYRALEPFEKLTDANPSWGKHENHQIARHITREDLADTDLGKFLEELE